MNLRERLNLLTEYVEARARGWAAFKEKERVGLAASQARVELPPGSAALEARYQALIAEDGQYETAERQLLASIEAVDADLLHARCDRGSHNLQLDCVVDWLRLAAD